MTTTAKTTTPDGPTRQRASQLMAASTTPTWDEALAQAGEALAAEHAANAERQAAADASAESFRRLTSCGVCGSPAVGSRDGVCEECRPLFAQVAADRRGAELVDGRSLRERAEALHDRRAGA